MSFAEELYKDKPKQKSHLNEETFVHNLFLHDGLNESGLVGDVKRMMIANKETKHFIAGVYWNSNEECVYKELNPKSSIGFTNNLDWDIVKKLLEEEIMDPSNDLGLKILKISIVEKNEERMYQTSWGGIKPRFEKRNETVHHIWIDASW